MTSFPQLRFFSEKEFAPHPEKMSHDFLYRLDSFREYLRVPMFVTSSSGGSHSPTSFHYKGLAADIIVPEQKGSLAALWLMAERFDFTGIGIYPEWEYNGKKCGGLHLDYRPMKFFQGARWIGIKKLNPDTQKLENKYFPLNIANLKRYRIII